MDWVDRLVMKYEDSSGFRLGIWIGVVALLLFLPLCGCFMGMDMIEFNDDAIYDRQDVEDSNYPVWSMLCGFVVWLALVLLPAFALHFNYYITKHDKNGRG